MNKARLEELRKIKTGFDFVMGLTPDWAEGRRAGLTDDQTEIIVNYVYQALSRNLLALIDSALAEPSDAEVAKAIEWHDNQRAGCAVSFKNFDKEEKYFELAVQALRQYQKPTDEAVRVAIEWLEAEKASAQNNWERAGAEWRMEPGAQEMHDEQMAAFDLAIQALCQMKQSEWIKVSERLPTEELASVLVYTKDGGVSEGQYYPTIKSWKQFRWSVENATVTHWMPLPKPPESED